MISVHNEPFAHRFMLLSGHTASNLFAKLIFNAKIIIKVPGNKKYPSDSKAVFTNDLSWNDPEKKNMDTLRSASIQSMSYVNIRLLTLEEGVVGYKIGGSDTVITDKEKEFTLWIKGSDSISSSWRVRIVNKGNKIDDLEITIRKKYLSSKMRMRLLSLKKLRLMLIGD
jgi:hypothetical protein